MSDEPLRSTEIDALMRALSPDDPSHPVIEPTTTVMPATGAAEGAAGPGIAGNDHAGNDHAGNDGSNDDDTSPSATPRKRKKSSALTEWVIVIAVVVSAALMVGPSLLQQFAVSGYSMINSTTATGSWSTSSAIASTTRGVETWWCSRPSRAPASAS